MIVGVAGDVRITGDLIVGGSCTGCSSDMKLKQNIHLLNSALSKIEHLRGVSYDWRDNVRESKVYAGPQIGVLAQDVEAVFPELVGTDSRGYKFVRYQKLVAPLIEAVKELSLQNAKQEAEIKTLMKRFDELEARLEVSSPKELIL
ncbi:MAG: tail fiber domain-containing protein [Alcanivoracaceae bacterium]|nr:tail fiber domain-containing protein [Alcanivoracaceae bacterium]